MVIPVKLAAEQAFLALFQVVNSGDTLFEVCRFFFFSYFCSSNCGFTTRTGQVGETHTLLS